MKTVKSMMIGFVLLFVSAITFAGPKAAKGGLTKDDVMSTYLNAVVHGKLDGIDNAINDDAEFDMKRGDNVTTLTKDQILAALKSSANVEQDCTCTKTVIQDTDDAAITKVEMKYKDFTRTDLVTIQHSDEGAGYRITRVETSYK